MNGRLQIDLYNYFRRDYNLTSYKLDYVSGYFIGDVVKKLEYSNGNTKIYSKNLIGLENNSFVNFEENCSGFAIFNSKLNDGSPGFTMSRKTLLTWT
jgi:hypothetical protein